MAPQYNAGISYVDNGMVVSARSMAASLEVFNVHSDNIAYSAIPGYQAQRPVVRPFVEHLGPYSVQQSTSEVIGRLRNSGQAQDLALMSEGYFQKLNPTTGEVLTTRDGRTHLDKDGYLLAHDGAHFLDVNGQAIQLSQLPDHFGEQVKVEKDGTLTFFDPKTQTLEKVARFGIVSSQGDPVKTVEMAQGVVEESNVFLAQEFSGVLPLRRVFEANRQLFLIHSSNMQRMIQDLGRAQ